MSDHSADDGTGRRHDWLVFWLGWAVMLARWVGQRRYKERLADVEVPNAILWPLVSAGLVRRRELDRASANLTGTMSEAGSLIRKRMEQSDARSEQLVGLQASMERLARAADERDRRLERMTRWLVLLTVVIGLIGLAGIGATVWSVLR